MRKNRESTAFICRAALIAAAYTVMTFLTFGFSSGAIQLRLSEGLCILAVFTPAAIPGLTVGCVVANLISGSALWDVVFGSLATLLGTLGVRALRKLPYLAPIPYVLANTLVVPLVLMWVYGSEETYFFLLASIGISELITAYGLGVVIYLAMRKIALKLFGTGTAGALKQKTRK